MPGADRAWPKRLSDAELACLAVAQVLLGARSEHHWLRLCYGRLGHLFPYLPKQPGYHKRLKAAAPLLAEVMDYRARGGAVLARPGAADRRDPGAVRRLPGNGPAARSWPGGRTTATARRIRAGTGD